MVLSLGVLGVAVFTEPGSKAGVTFSFGFPRPVPAYSGLAAYYDYGPHDAKGYDGGPWDYYEYHLHYWNDPYHPVFTIVMRIAAGICLLTPGIII